MVCLSFNGLWCFEAHCLSFLQMNLIWLWEQWDTLKHTHTTSKTKALILYHLPIAHSTLQGQALAVPRHIMQLYLMCLQDLDKAGDNCLSVFLKCTFYNGIFTSYAISPLDKTSRQCLKTDSPLRASAQLHMVVMCILLQVKHVNFFVSVSLAFDH